MNMPALTCMVVRLRDCSRGAIVIEMALVASILAVILLGLLEWVAYVRQTMQLANAARAGVEYAIAYPSDAAGIEQTVLSSGHVVSADLTIDIAQFCECSDGTPIACADVCLDGVQSNVLMRVALSQPAHSLLNASGLMSSYTATASATLRVR